MVETSKVGATGLLLYVLSSGNLSFICLLDLQGHA